MRTFLIVIGLAVSFFNRLLPMPYFIISLVAGMAFTLWGCYLWVKLKDRHIAFMFWGLLSPIGLLGISLLKDKTSGKEKVK